VRYLELFLIGGNPVRGACYDTMGLNDPYSASDTCPPALVVEFTPRAFVITPIHSNAVVVTNSFFSGNLMFNGTVPITDATANVNVPILSFHRSFSFFGRSANATASLPYGVGHFKGTVLDTEATVYRSGMIDSVYRVAINLKGGSAMGVREFMK
jgi:hypothetical protein